MRSSADRRQSYRESIRKEQLEERMGPTRKALRWVEGYSENEGDKMLTDLANRLRGLAQKD